MFRAEVAFGSEYVGMTKIVAHLAIGALQIDLVAEVKIIPRSKYAYNYVCQCVLFDCVFIMWVCLCACVHVYM